jgi:hypothetical protein
MVPPQQREISWKRCISFELKRQVAARLNSVRVESAIGRWATLPNDCQNFQICWSCSPAAAAAGFTRSQHHADATAGTAAGDAPPVNARRN